MEALRNTNMDTDILNQQQRRIDYISSLTENPTTISGDLQFNASFISSDLPITPQKVLWKVWTQMNYEKWLD